MKIDYLDQTYPSHRFPVMARNGMVCTGNALASACGLRILQQGGNAVDAAIATAAALTVIEPTANGIGSDAFAIVWMNEELVGLNGSGVAPELLSVDAVKAKHGDIKQMPQLGWTPVTVPGTCKAWAALNQRFGKLTLLECLKPAIEYAENGYPLAPETARMWKKAVERYSKEEDPSFKEWFATFTKQGKAYEAGDLVILKNHAKSLEEIGRTQSESFYCGDLAKRIDEISRKEGGFLRYADLAKYDIEWVDPIRMDYRGYSVCEIPPNGQGIVALMGLNILKNFEFSMKESVDTFHKQFEAMKMAFSDGRHFVSDPRKMQVSAEELLSKEMGQKRAAMIHEKAGEVEPIALPHSGTVYLCTADKDGNMVSYIQSNYMGFGSGIVVDGTGIALQNRGADFSLDLNHVNLLEPNKKTYHTIIPGFLMKEKQAIGPFGIMGGAMQPQAHVQVMMNFIDFGLNPQMALDAPRWQWMGGKKFTVESHFDANIARALQQRGHEIEVVLERGGFGRGQMILRLENGTYVAGCESRTDSNIACY